MTGSEHTNDSRGSNDDARTGEQQEAGHSGEGVASVMAQLAASGRHQHRRHGGDDDDTDARPRA